MYFTLGGTNSTTWNKINNLVNKVFKNDQILNVKQYDKCFHISHLVRKDTWILKRHLHAYSFRVSFVLLQFGMVKHCLRASFNKYTLNNSCHCFFTINQSMKWLLISMLLLMVLPYISYYVTPVYVSLFSTCIALRGNSNSEHHHLYKHQPYID